ncbi:hypothetical protein CYMTET_8246 [Cymbomonas tetramitiformis]|uniref:Trafficking protein particle complex subunit n=1 Tax=Cymbomonas tetramitiformis TaxID=36881 RepID=A0AAE0LGN4_9CHLO|nr:hypothetical protein CYMTET_8246 [Cymbomonas tetramitiformis]
MRKGAPSVLDRPIGKGKTEVSLSAFAFLFSELVQYSQQRVTKTDELEKRLEVVGVRVGERILELLCYREKASRRERKLLDMLGFVHTNVWKCLFGKAAESLEESVDDEDTYYISDKELLVNRFISVPKDWNLNCGSFVAGVVKGVLDSAGFSAQVTAHYVKSELEGQSRTTIVMKFSPEVMAREQRIAS